jgi:hypothetical protein
MAPTVASTDPALRTADGHVSDTASAPPPGFDAGARAGSPTGEEVSATVELAVMDLARLIAGSSCDDAEALGTIARVASRLAGRHEGLEGPAVESGPEEERPVAAAGSWSLSNGMLNVVLGEN